MNLRIVFLALAAFCVAPGAYAEPATVVTACGAASLTPGTVVMSLQDINGVACSGYGGKVRVVAACGSLSPFGPLRAGEQAYSTVDTTGMGCGFGAAVAASSVWSATDAAANAMTLSNGGLTVAATTGTWGSVRGTQSKTSGKLYVEFLVNAGSTLTVFIPGLASSSFVPTSYLSTSVYSGGIMVGTGNNFVSSGFTSNYLPPSGYSNAGDVIALAVDFATGGVWTGENNIWINASNPATGSLPVISFVPATVGALFPALSLQSSGGTWTLHATAASQKYAPPSGFSPWN